MKISRSPLKTLLPAVDRCSCEVTDLVLETNFVPDPAGEPGVGGAWGGRNFRDVSFAGSQRGSEENGTDH
jgi:hypothetical protein